PKAPFGSPVNDTNHFIASISQNMPPAPSIQYAPWILEAEVTKSNIMEALVGEAGTNARCLGWSIGTVALIKTSLNNSNARSPPIPCSVMVSPTKALNSSSDFGCPNSGETVVILFKTYFMTSRVISTLSMSISYINTTLDKGSLLNRF